MTTDVAVGARKPWSSRCLSRGSAEASCATVSAAGPVQDVEPGDGKPVAGAVRFDVRRWRGGREGEFVLLNHQILSRSLKAAMQRGRSTRNVSTLVDPPTVGPQADRALDRR